MELSRHQRRSTLHVLFQHPASAPSFQCAPVYRGAAYMARSGDPPGGACSCGLATMHQGEEW
eukprot:485318-Pyramimonas_sp.AAC.1